MTGIGIINALAMVGTESILPILFEARLAERRTLLFATHPSKGNVVGMGRVAITHGMAIFVVHACRPIVAILLGATSVDGDLAL